MKTTRTVDVFVCDVCHDSWDWTSNFSDSPPFDKPYKCLVCRKEMCGECTKHWQGGSIGGVCRVCAARQDVISLIAAQEQAWTKAGRELVDGLRSLRGGDDA